jgi:hypothetical protein
LNQAANLLKTKDLGGDSTPDSAKKVNHLQMIENKGLIGLIQKSESPFESP